MGDSGVYIGQMNRLLKTFVLAALLSTPAYADGERAGDFDYYVMSLSWTPTWCELDGDDRNSPQCKENRGFGFTLHGLWPQYEQGWPSFCRTSHRDPSRSQTNAMADITGTGGLAWYEWKKHGRCSGLSAPDYFSTARSAYEGINRPEVLRSLTKELELPASVIEAAFLEANPDMQPDQITVTCKAGFIQEVRICLTRDLELRSCAADVARDCTLQDAILQPIR